MKFEFLATIARWPGNASYYFCLLPEAMALEITEVTEGLRRGFGSVRVDARCGESNWCSSIFKDSASNSYLLLLKKAVRDAEGLADGSQVKIQIELIDF